MRRRQRLDDLAPRIRRSRTTPTTHKSQAILSHGWLNMQFVAKDKRQLVHCTGPSRPSISQVDSCRFRQPSTNPGASNRDEQSPGQGKPGRPDGVTLAGGTCRLVWTFSHESADVRL